jgi:histidinol-phosphate aminotransferase
MSNSAFARPSPRPELLEIQRYVPGRSSVPGVAEIHKLSSNESPLGASPRAIAAYRGEAERLALYPDGGSRALRSAIAAKYDLDPERILVGNGSDELLTLLAHVYLRPGDEGLYSEFGFATYPIAIRGAGGTPVIAREIALTASVDNLLEKVSPRTRIVFLANPNNPTGTYLPFSEVERLHRGLPKTVLLVLDAAYAEYISAADYDCGLALAEANENVVMTRTFSKIHGLAYLRLGWALAPREVVDIVNVVRGAFNVNGPATAAGVAALADDDHVREAVAHNARWLPWLTAEIRALGLEVPPSVGNFVLVLFPPTGPRSAAEADDYLSARGFLLRGLGGYGLARGLRLTVGTEEANLGVVSALAAFMKTASHG